jgi:transposase
MFHNPACRHKLLFIPPWSPFLNPVEGLFTKVLGNVSRNSTDDTEEIKNAIMAALATVTVADCQQWIGAPLNFYHQCFQKQDWIG